MKKVLLIGLFLSLWITAPLHAAYIDLTIDGVSLLSDGDVYLPSDGEVTIDVWIGSDTSESLTNYSLAIWYDISEGISYSSGYEIEPTGWVSFSDFPVDNSPYIGQVEALNFASSDITLTEPLQVASLTFTYDAALLVEDGLADFAVYYQAGAGVSIGTLGDAVVYQPDSIGADIAAVPVPAAVWLLGSGLLGLVGLRRRNS